MVVCLMLASRRWRVAMRSPTVYERSVWVELSRLCSDAWPASESTERVKAWTSSSSVLTEVEDRPGVTVAPRTVWALSRHRPRRPLRPGHVSEGVNLTALRVPGYDSQSTVS